MLALQELIPPSSSQVQCTLLLEDGQEGDEVILLTAVNSIINAHRVDFTNCSVSCLGRQIDVGSPVLAMIGIQHQCFLAWTERGELFTIRYQANLPYRQNSVDAYSPDRHWFIVDQCTLSLPTLRVKQDPLFSVSNQKNHILCTLLEGFLFGVFVDFSVVANTVGFNDCWLDTHTYGKARRYATSDGVRMDESPEERLTRVEREWRECTNDVADEELLTKYTLSELAEWKHECESKMPTPSGVCPADRPIVHFGTRRFHPHYQQIHSISPRLSGGFEVVYDSGMVEHYSSVFPSVSGERSSDLPEENCVFAADFPPTATSDGARLLVSTASGTVFSWNDAFEVRKTFTEAVTLVDCVVRMEEQQAWYCDVWCVLSDGSIACVTVDQMTGNCIEEDDDCLGTPWPRHCFDGIPSSFRARRILPVTSLHDLASFRRTERLSLISDLHSDYYVVDLKERRVVRAWTAGGTVSCMSVTPSGDLVTGSVNGKVKRHTPVCQLPGRYECLFPDHGTKQVSSVDIVEDRGVHYMLLTHLNTVKVFQWGVTGEDSFLIQELPTDDELCAKADDDALLLHATVWEGQVVQCTSTQITVGQASFPLPGCLCASSVRAEPNGEKELCIVTSDSSRVFLFSLTASGLTELLPSPHVTADRANIQSTRVQMLHVEGLVEVVVLCCYEDGLNELLCFSKERNTCSFSRNVSLPGRENGPIASACGISRAVTLESVGFMLYYTSGAVAQLTWSLKEGPAFHHMDSKKPSGHYCTAVRSSPAPYPYNALLLQQDTVRLVGLDEGNQFSWIQISPQTVRSTWHCGTVHYGLMVLVLCDSRGIWVASLTPLLCHFPLNTPTSLVVSQQRLLQLDDGDMLSDLFCIPHTSSLLCVVSSDSLVRLVSLDSHSLEPFDSIVLPQPDACCLCARLLPSSEDDATSGGTLLLGSVDFERTCGYLSVVRVCQFVEEVTKVRTSGAVTDVAFGEKGRSIIACCGTNVCVYHLHSDRLLLVAEYNCGVLCTSVAVVRNVVSVGLEDTSHVFFSLSANDLLARIGDDYRSSTLQGEYFGNLARVGADGGVLLSSLGYPTPKPTTAEYPAVGLKGVVDVCLLHAFRLPSPCAKVTKLPTVSAFRSNQLSFRLCGQEARFNSPPDSMYMACRDGSLFAAREIPFAFSNPLSRLGKCISDFFPYSLVLCRCDEAEGGIARRFRGVPQDRVLPARQGGEYLRPQGVLDMRLFDELNVLRSLELSELVEDEVNPIKDKLAALGYAMEEITFQEYSNNLSVLDCIQMLNCV